MCGIAGIVRWDGRPAFEHEIRSMCGAMVHRGPDDEGVYVDGGVAIGMRRLSIIDLNSGHQPVSNEDGSVWIVFNGEIYNYQELRRNLIQKGHVFRTHSDTETIVHLYEDMGTRCVEPLRGMFAFAIWDSRRRQVLLARDRLGIKPLYYAERDGELLFASELKPILAIDDVDRSVSWQAAGHLFSFLATPPDQSIVEGVAKLEPARTAVSMPGRPLQIQQYWDVSFEPDEKATEGELVERLRALLDESVTLHQVSDVPVGAFLSGGVDSSAIVGMMAKPAAGRFKTFSIGFAEAGFDELEHARRVAAAFGTDHHDLVLRPDVVEIVEDLTWYLDEPFGDTSAIPTYMVSKLAAEHVKVVLSGDGGDELFAGYDRYVVEGRERAYERIPKPLRRIAGAVGAAMPHGMRGRRFLRHLALDGHERYLDASTLLHDDEMASLFKDDILAGMGGGHHAVPQEQTYGAPYGYDDVIGARRVTPHHWLDALQYRDLHHYLPLDILTKVDRMTMAHSLEARPPLLDHRLVEFAATIPAQYRLRGGTTKYLFKQAMRGLLPDGIIDRQKHGFAVPLARWFRGDLSAFARDILLSDASRRRGVFNLPYVERMLQLNDGGRDLDLPLWTMLSFELWCRRFLDRTPEGVATDRRPEGLRLPVEGAAGRLGRRRPGVGSRHTPSTGRRRPSGLRVTPMDNAPPFPLDPLLGGAHAERRDRGGLRRMRDMRFAEIAYRGWQEASRWLERAVPVDSTDTPAELLWRQAPDLSEPEAALTVLRAAGPRRFFAGVDDAGMPAALVERLPAERDAIAAAADAFDISEVLEHNRHQGLMRLAQAHVLTGDERYAQRCVRALDAWLDAHPPGVQSPMDHSAVASHRLVSWCWALLLLRDSPALGARRVHRALASIYLQATHVRRYLSHDCSKNTDLTTEALALFYVATLFPEFHDAERWREVAARILVSECEAQIYADGVHFEQSTCYHRHTLDTYLQYTLLAARNGVAVPGHVADRVGRMVEFLVAIRQPDGTIPSIGDDDGGTMLGLAERTPGDTRGLFASAAAQFGRPDFAWAAGGLAPEVLWLMGTGGAATFDGLRPAPPVTAPSRVFPSGGYAIMRSGWDDQAHQMVVDVGPLGCPVSAGHGHADLLSLQCSIFGEPCLVDSGSSWYSDRSPWRDYFRSTAAHSTVVVDGVSQAEPEGAFGWRRQPRVRLREWHSTPEFDFLDAEHDGYLALPDPVVHRRRVIFIKPGYWMVVDDLSGSARHQVDVTFQFDTMGVTLEAHPWARAETPQGRVLWISSFPFAPAQPSIKSGAVSPTSGWISREYGERQPAPMLIYSFAVALPWRILTLLLPDRQGSTTPPSARAIYDATGLPTGVAFERPRRTVRFDDQAVSVERE